MKNKPVLIITFFALYLSAFCQDSIDFNRQPVSLGLNYGIFRNQAFIKNTLFGNDDNVMKLKYRTCRQFGAEISVPLYKQLRIYSGASWKYLYYYDGFSIPANNSWKPGIAGEITSENNDYYWSFPLGVIYPLIQKNHTQVLIKGGIAINYAEWQNTRSTVFVSETNMDTISSIQFETNYKEKINISGELGLTARYNFKNLSFFELNFFSSFSPQKSLKGFIDVYHDNKVTTKTEISSNHNSVGLGITYGLYFNKNIFKTIINKRPVEQKIHYSSFEFKGGLNKSMIEGKEPDGSKTGLRTVEAYAGFSYYEKLQDKYDIGAGILFSWTDFNPYIELPIHLKYWHINRLNFFAGPKVDVTVDSAFYKSCTKIKNYNQWGLSLEIGTQYTLSRRLFAELCYSRGLTNNYDDPDLDIFNGHRNTLRFGIGIYFLN